MGTWQARTIYPSSLKKLRCLRRPGWSDCSIEVTWKRRVNWLSFCCQIIFVQSPQTSKSLYRRVHALANFRLIQSNTLLVKAGNASAVLSTRHIINPHQCCRLVCDSPKLSLKVLWKNRPGKVQSCFSPFL